MQIARLTVITRGSVREFVVTPGAAATLGRSSRCTMSLRDPKVSRVHCKLLFERGRVVVVDLDSAHGIDHLGERKPLLSIEPGDGFRIGQSFVRFDAVEEVSAPGLGPDAPGPASAAHSDPYPLAATAQQTVDWRSALAQSVTTKRPPVPGTARSSEGGSRSAEHEAVTGHVQPRRPVEHPRRSSSKALLARLAGESVVFTIHMALCLVVLVALRIVFGFDLYRTFGLR